MAAYGRRSGPGRGRDVYPLRVLATGVGFVVVVMVAVVWALLSDGGRVVVPDGASAASEETPAASVEEAASREPVRQLADVGGDQVATALPGPVSSDADSAAPARDESDAPAATGVQAARSESERQQEPTRPRTGARPPAPERRGADAAALAQAFHEEGVYRLEHGDVEIAVDRLAQAVENAPSDASMRSSFGRALLLAREPRRAADQLERAVRLDPAFAEPLPDLAEARLALGDTAAALAAYLRFIRLNDDPEREAEAERRLRQIRGG